MLPSTSSASVAQKIHLLHCRRDDSSYYNYFDGGVDGKQHAGHLNDSRVLFHQPASSSKSSSSSTSSATSINLTYGQCSKIINEHEVWLTNVIGRQHEQCAAVAVASASSATTTPVASASLSSSPSTLSSSLPSVVGGKINTSQIIIKDTIIGYISDNSPDLLLSLLSCMNLALSYREDRVKWKQQQEHTQEDPKESVGDDYNLHADEQLQDYFDQATATGATTTKSSTNQVALPPIILPAMINCRWTSLEIEKALSPFPNTVNHHHHQQQQQQCQQRHHRHENYDQIHHLVHITILLYGDGYEMLAKEAAKRSNNMATTMMMNGKQEARMRSHYVIALPLPELARQYYRSNVIRGVGSSSTLLRQQHDIDGNSEMEPPPSSSSLPPASPDNDVKNNISNTDALLLFTSGTTSTSGTAKGVRLSHRSLFIQSHAKTLPPCKYDKDTCMMANTVPWFHVGGISSALGVILAGGCLVFPPRQYSPSSFYTQPGGGSGSPRRNGVGFRPDLILQSLSQRELLLTNTMSPSVRSSSTSCIAANTLVVVPAMLHAIFAECNTARNSRSSLISPSYPDVRLVLVGGQSIFASSSSGNDKYKLYQQTRRLFPNARIVQTYACTEAGSSITFEDLLEGDEDGKDCGNDSRNTATVADDDISGTNVGYPPPHIQVEIFHPLAGGTTAAKANYPSPSATSPPQLLRPLPHGQTGIIGTRGPHVMSGYWNRSGYDASNYDDCGWMLTNDLGYIDPQNGKLYFRGRADDVIRTGGESVLASDVERVIVDYFAENDEDHAFVECAVFPLPDEKFGEAVCAAVVLAPLISSAVSMSSSSSEVSRRADVGLAAINSNTGSCNECNDMIMVNENEEMMLKIRRYFAERQIAGYKRPRRVFRMRHALPRNASGKVWKHAVIRLCAEAMAKETSRL